MRLATEGIVLDVPVDLVFPCIPEAPRRLQVKLQAAYTQHAVKLWGKRDVMSRFLSFLLAIGRSTMNLDFSSHRWN